MGEGDSPPDRESQALQESGRAVDRPEHRALTTDHAGCPAQGYLTRWNPVLSSKSSEQSYDRAHRDLLKGRKAAEPKPEPKRKPVQPKLAPFTPFRIVDESG